MNKVRANITLDPKIKNEAIKVLDDLGLDLSTAINLFLKQVIVNDGLPFDLSKSKKNIYFKYKQLKDFVEGYFGFKDAKYTPINKIMTKKEIKEANEEIAKIKSGKIKLKTFNNFGECLKEMGIEI